MNYSSYIPQIVEELKKSSPHKIILFGSYAYGQPNEDSDLDLMVVTNHEHTPGSFKEKMNLYHEINPLIKNFRKKIPIDLIVYTRPMYKTMQDNASMFIKEINQKGKLLYEAVH